MALSDDQLEQIGRYVPGKLPQWIRTLAPQTVQITDPALLERPLRVEEKLKAQRELMLARFGAVDNDSTRHSRVSAFSSLCSWGQPPTIVLTL